MAKMIPSHGPREHDARSKEGVIYAALRDLDDNYIVVHSMVLTSVLNGTLKENEADFIIFNKDKGLICFEAKAGQVTYERGEWMYANGTPMKHGGPFNQAQNIKYRLIDEFRDKGLGNILKSCRIYHAVWFPSIELTDLQKINLPEDGDLNLVLTKDDLANPQLAIERIFDIDIPFRQQSLTDSQSKQIIEKILCPHFQVVPTARTRYDFDDITFARLLKSQVNVLNFLSEQKTAVINGIAGSGKTLIAVEKAKRLAAQNELVLFLCYNKLLSEDVESRCEDFPNIDVYTIDALTMRFCSSLDYDGFTTKLLEHPELFKYQHVIVDEGQDFGSDNTDNSKSEVLSTLRLLIEERGGNFYLFYDKFQLIQGTNIPDFINDADCKLTLWVNCRNTFNIAKCATSSLDVNIASTVNPESPDGTIPKLAYAMEVNTQVSFVDRYISELKILGLSNIVILTCKTENTSVLQVAFEGEKSRLRWKQSDVPVYSCRRFKGMEADAVILIDVSLDLWIRDESSAFQPDPGLMFYTGASRAKHELRIVCDMNEDDFNILVKNSSLSLRRNPVKVWARQLNALPDN